MTRSSPWDTVESYPEIDNRIRRSKTEHNRPRSDDTAHSATGARGRGREGFERGEFGLVPSTAVSPDLQRWFESIGVHSRPRRGHRRMGADMQQHTISREQQAWITAVHEWKASGKPFSATKVLARRDQLLSR